ncbi:transcription factor DIVARICATA-like [Neltuma alba]|uniref:transcription factor DIVARICATA-like n=1 Tax=Neltuma alba TaxID=207710 RepID=UPI0010A50655|nr:transcription factor DIVARICATA-like [Prosopis alba]
MGSRSKEADKLFESAPVCFPEGRPIQWERTTEVAPGTTKEMVYQRHDDVEQIDLGRVPPPDYPDYSWPSSAKQPPKCSGPIRKKRSSWSLDEHILFLVGVEIHGKGKWKKISENVVRTRSVMQVASHAQKFYLLQRKRDARVKRRKGGINALTLENICPHCLNHILSSIPSLHHHHHQVHYDVPVSNQSSSSGLQQLQEPYHCEPNSHVHEDDLPMQHQSLGMNQSYQSEQHQSKPPQRPELINP